MFELVYMEVRFSFSNSLACASSVDELQIAWHGIPRLMNTFVYEVL